LRADLPIWLGAEGPKNVALAAEICDGWLPLYYSPYRPEVYADQLAGARPGFEIAATVPLNVSDDVATALLPVKAMLGLYIGGMGARKRNFHKELMSRMGFAAEAERVQQLFFENRRRSHRRRARSIRRRDFPGGPDRPHPRPGASMETHARVDDRGDVTGPVVDPNGGRGGAGVGRRRDEISLP
jgi:alkanesulfonate monooxygenase SsuD/methylene tetrahydromethanopterin reductase-like flavin-dependent oxidoreductase (luciferase family)